jgi:UDP-N-acetylglucosamine--N-acetylmuramyl-(pentapeptide) pyrophosphoryl-undecaprenol N-acetylglucosamine transferase
LSAEKKTMLIIGGSLGARSLNESVKASLPLLENSGIQLLWQCGSYYHDWAAGILSSYQGKNIVLLPFIKEMNRAFQVADLIISRAGAGTISELCLIGKPVILVPSPNVAEDHQTSNAKALTDKKASEMIADKDAREKLIPSALELLADKVKLELLSGNIRKLAIPDSADRIAKEVMEILEVR